MPSSKEAAEQEQVGHLRFWWSQGAIFPGFDQHILVMVVSGSVFEDDFFFLVNLKLKHECHDWRLNRRESYLFFRGP